MPTIVAGLLGGRQTTGGRGDCVEQGCAASTRMGSFTGIAPFAIAIATRTAWRQGAKKSGINATNPCVDRSGIPEQLEG